MSIPSIADIELHGKRVLVRVDVNVPMYQGAIRNDARIRAIVPTLRYLLLEGALVMVASHLGRPQQPSPEFSLAPVAHHLSELLNYPVRLVEDWAKPSYRGPSPGRIDLWENTRFEAGELDNTPELSKTMSRHCDVFVLDAFAAAHRAHASTCGVVEYVTTACAGPLLLKELKALRHFVVEATHPLLAIVGGAKVSTKLTLLKRLLEAPAWEVPDQAEDVLNNPYSYSEAPISLSDLQHQLALVDSLILGGGILNTCLMAQGLPIGASLHEPALLNEAKQLLSLAKTRGVTIPMPDDVIVIPENIDIDDPQASDQSRCCEINQVGEHDKIVDIGPRSAKKLVELVKQANTILWNGPLGVFEIPAFAQGTLTVAQSVAENKGYSVAGGGDTLAAIEAFGLSDTLSYCSTGGGAFLAFLEGKPLPALQALDKKDE